MLAFLGSRDGSDLAGPLLLHHDEGASLHAANFSKHSKGTRIALIKFPLVYHYHGVGWLTLIDYKN